VPDATVDGFKLVWANAKSAKQHLGPEIPATLRRQALQFLPCAAAEKMLERLGPDAEKVLAKIRRNPRKGEMLCECEMVSVAEVEQVASDEDTHQLADIRRKTRLGMGTCQGAFCAYRALPLLWQEKGKYDPLQEELKRFIILLIIAINYPDGAGNRILM
jgi:glycerol-3-phosphate dehydrogenase